MRVEKNWWKDFFDEIYLVTDARSVCDEKVTSKEVDFLENFLRLRRNDKILDLCGGQGRHSIELARRGYKDITVFDYSDFLIRKGKGIAKKMGLCIKFRQGDARCTRFKDNSFSVIIIMANSFGYFKNDMENLKILKECYRLLKENGRLFLDMSDCYYVKSHLRPVSFHQANEDIFVIRKRIIKDDIVVAREVVISRDRGVLKDRCYCEKLYTKELIKELLKKADFTEIFIRRNIFSRRGKGDYGLLTSRMSVLAKK